MLSPNRKSICPQDHPLSSYKPPKLQENHGTKKNQAQKKQNFIHHENLIRPVVSSTRCLFDPFSSTCFPFDPFFLRPVFFDLFSFDLFSLRPVFFRPVFPSTCFLFDLLGITPSTPTHFCSHPLWSAIRSQRQKGECRHADTCKFL